MAKQINPTTAPGSVVSVSTPYMGPQFDIGDVFGTLAKGFAEKSERDRLEKMKSQQLQEGYKAQLYPSLIASGDMSVGEAGDPNATSFAGINLVPNPDAMNYKQMEKRFNALNAYDRYQAFPQQQEYQKMRIAALMNSMRNSSQGGISKAVATKAILEGYPALIKDNPELANLQDSDVNPKTKKPWLPGEQSQAITDWIVGNQGRLLDASTKMLKSRGMLNQGGGGMDLGMDLGTGGDMSTGGPAAETGQQRYVNPQTGQVAISNDGQTWYDESTGEIIQE